MKIVRIIARLNVGGPARHVVWVTRGLEPDHNTVLVAGTVPAGEEDMSYFAAENGVDPIFLPELSRELSPKDVLALFKLYNLLRRERPDVIHTHTAKAGTVGRLAAFLYRWLTPGTLIGRPRRVKVVHTFHGHVFHSYYGQGKTRLFIAIERFLARFATDRIVVLSINQLDEINGTFHVGRREKFRIVPLGLELGAFSIAKNSSLRQELNVAAEDLLVGFTGRLTEIKNLGLMLEGVKVCVERGAKLRFAIIGDGHLRSELEQKADDLGIRDIVTFLGNRNDIADLVSSLDIFVLTSKNEGTPLSMIEAMAAGIPVASTAVGGVRDLLGPTQEEFKGFRICERGVAIDTANAEDFANGLIYLAKNERLRERLSATSPKYVRDQFSKERLISDISALYSDLIEP